MNVNKTLALYVIVLTSLFSAINGLYLEEVGWILWVIISLSHFVGFVVFALMVRNIIPQK